MGCTSSAPNMAASNPNATEMNLQINEEKHDATKNYDDDMVHRVEENGTNELKVLPSCDTLAEPLQLDSNNKSMLDPNDLELEKVITANKQTENKSMPNEDDDNPTEDEEKLSSLEEVVEKVVELYVLENTPIKDEVKEQELNTDDMIVPKINDVEGSNVTTISNSEKQETGTEPNELENTNEPASPSQSTSSRATRWEALADIAAELPPSLAVDPLTGQIYTVTK